MKPLFDRVIIKEDIEPQKTSSGIILVTEDKAKKYSKGIVVSVGEQVKELAPNDRIFFLKGAGQEIDDKGEMVRLVRLDEILLKEQVD